MSAATNALATGFNVLLGFHGEIFSYVPATDVLMTDWGEAFSTEEGAPILAGNVPAVNVALIFDAAYQYIDPADVGGASRAPIARGFMSHLPGLRKNAVLVRALDSARYVVRDFQPDGLEDGVVLLILSKQVH